MRRRESPPIAAARSSWRPPRRSDRGSHNLLERGTANGVQGLELIGPERLHEIEPHCVGVEALWSPNTGIVDYNLVTRAYADDVRNSGGEILPGWGVVGIDERPDGVVLRTPAGEVQANHAVACAGLYADRVARMTGAPPDPRIVPVPRRLLDPASGPT